MTAGVTARQGGGEAARASAGLALGVLVLRWAGLAWMALLVVIGADTFRRPGLAQAALAGTAVWTALLTARHGRMTRPALAADLLVAAGLVLLVGPVTGPVAAGGPVFTTIYPLAAVLSWGAGGGFRAGLAAGAALGAALVAGVLWGGSPAGGRYVLGLAGDVGNFLLAGGATGLVGRLLDRSAAEVRAAQAAEVRAREQAARLAEREALARDIHDSVLQALALVHKRGRELAAGDAVPAAAVARLADLARAQERAVRSLLLAPAAPAAPGLASLPEALERAAGVVAGPGAGRRGAARGPPPPAGVGAAGGAPGEEPQANRDPPPRAPRAGGLAHAGAGEGVVHVRDDGAGFAYEPAALAASGKIGLLRSMRGRIEELGGTMTVDSAPGRGTEIAFRVPAAAG